MEVCRGLGLRDSYVFFARHPAVSRINASDDDKAHLVSHYKAPNQIRGRILPIVTARSVFRALGRRVIHGGQEARDDYWVSVKSEQDSFYREREARERERERDRELRELKEAESRNPFTSLIPEEFDKIMKRTILSASEFNSKLRSQRPSKFFDIHTNLQQYPKSSRPSRLDVEVATTSTDTNNNILNASSTLVIEDKIIVKNSAKEHIGLAIVGESGEVDEEGRNKSSSVSWSCAATLDEMDDKYPVGILAGQYRSGYSM